MPARGHATAPTFDPSQPRTLRQYFADLEVLYTSCQIATEVEKKRYVAHYTDIDTSELIESQDKFGDTTKMYADLKSALLKLYPGAEEERKYTNKDLESLILLWQCCGIHSVSELGSYHRDFLTISHDSSFQNSVSLVYSKEPSLFKHSRPTPGLLPRLVSSLSSLTIIQTIPTPSNTSSRPQPGYTMAHFHPPFDLPSPAQHQPLL